MPGDGVVRDTMATGTVILIEALHILRTPWSLKVSTTTSWLIDALDRCDARVRDFTDIQPGVVVERRSCCRRADQRGDIGPGRGSGHQLLELISIHLLPRSCDGAAKNAAAGNQQSRRQSTNQRPKRR